MSKEKSIIKELSKKIAIWKLAVLSLILSIVSAGLIYFYPANEFVKSMGQALFSLGSIIFIVKVQN